MNEFDIKSSLTQSLSILASDPHMSPFLFRTRFERCMIRLSDYAQKNQQPELFNLAVASQNKMNLMSNRSNTTMEGELWSHALLVDDIQQMLCFMRK